MLIFIFLFLHLNSLWRLATILSVSEKTTSQSRCAEHMVTKRSSSQAKLACEITPKEGCLFQKIICICSCCLVDWKKKQTKLPCLSLQFEFIQCSEVRRVMILDCPLWSHYNEFLFCWITETYNFSSVFFINSIILQRPLMFWCHRGYDG